MFGRVEGWLQDRDQGRIIRDASRHLDEAAAQKRFPAVNKREH
jgi:hypothetical protein